MMFLLTFCFVILFHTINSQVQLVELGYSAQLVCRPEGTNSNYPINYIWYDPNYIEISRQKIVKIKNFNKDLEGMYTCKASQIINGKENSKSKSVRLVLKVGDFDVSLPSKYSTVIGGGILLEAKVEPTQGKYTYKWTGPNGQILGSDKILYKNSVNMNNAGMYTVTITDQSTGKVISKSIPVVVLELQLKVTAQQKNLKMGESALLTCAIDLSTIQSGMIGNSYKFSWKNPNGQIIKNDKDVLITYRNPSDLGVYTCQVTATNTVPPYSQSTALLISGSSSPTSYRVTFISSPTKPSIGQDIILDCTVTPPATNVIYQIKYNDNIVSQGSRYIINNFQRNNAGQYKCVSLIPDPITNSLKTKESVINLIPDKPGNQIAIQYSSAITINPTQPQIGQNLNMLCQVSPVPNGVTYEIRHNGRLVSTTNSYNIPVLGMTHMGDYNCTITGRDQFNNQVKMIKILNIKMPISSTNQYIATMNLSPKVPRIGDKLVIICEISSPLNDVSYKIEHNGLIVSNSNIHTINAFGNRDLGKYNCIITGRDQSNREVKLVRTLNINENPSANVNIILTPSSPRINESLAMHCRISKRPNHASFEIFHKDKSVSATSMYLIEKLNNSHLGLYKCVVTGRNMADNTIVQFRGSIQLNQVMNPNANQYSMSLTMNRVQPQIGQNLNMLCQVSPVPNDVTYEIRHNGRLVSTSNSYNIPVLGMTHLGNYKCTIKGRDNSNNQIDISTTLNLKETSNSKTNQYSMSLTMNPIQPQVGQSLNLVCQVSPVPNDVTYEIRHNGQLVSTSNSYNIPVLGVTHVGNYKCTIKGRDNSNNQIDISTTLNLKDTSNSKTNQYSMSIAMNPIQPQVGQSLNLVCQVSPVPNGVTYEIRHNGQLVSTSNSYNIPVLGMTHLGNYKCTIKGRDNSNNQIDMFTTLNLKETSNSKKTDYENRITLNPNPPLMGQSLNIICQVSPVPNGATYEIRHNGQLVSTTNSYLIPNLNKIHFGNYLCVVKGRDRNSNLVTRRVEWQVGTGNVDIILSPTVPQIGQPLVIKCQVFNEPKQASYRIFHNNKLVSSSNIYRIPNLNQNHSGQYRCVVTGRDTANNLVTYSGSVNQQIDKITSQYTTRITLSRPNPTLGQSLTMNCQVFPLLGTATYQIKHNGNVVSTSNSYNIQVLDLKHYGQYTCTVSGRDSSNKMVKMEATLDFGRYGTMINFEMKPSPPILGQKMTLKCSVSPELIGGSYKIIFNGQPVSMSNKYEVSRFSNNNFGTYRCSVTGRDPKTNEIVTYTKLLGVSQNKSSAAIQYQSYMTISRDKPELGKSLIIRCIITPMPKGVSYQIKFKNQIVSVTNEYVIPSFEKRHMGLYDCIVRGQDDLNNPTYTVSNLRLYETSSPITVITNPSIPQIGNRFTIRCKVTPAPKDVSYEITYNNRILTNNHTYVIEKFEKRHLGTYQCIIQGKNSANKLIYLTKSINVHVVNTNPIQYKGTIILNPQTPQIGKSLTVFCAVNPLPNDVSYEITHNGRLIATTDTYTIAKFNSSYYGEYKCTITSRNSGNNKKITIFKTLQSLRFNPKATIRVNPSPAEPGKRLIMRCSVNALLENPTYEIYHDNILVSTSDSLTINKLDLKHMGYYKCVVKGINPDTRKNVKLEDTYPLIFSGSIEVSKPPGTTVSIYQGDRREIHCEIYDYVDLICENNEKCRGRHVKWYFNNQLLGPNELYRLGLSANPYHFVNILTIQDAKLKNAGRYDCRIAGVTRTVKIDVLKRYQNIFINPPFATRYVGQQKQVEFHCQITGFSSTITNKNLKWTFRSSKNNFEVPLDRAWSRKDTLANRETSFILLKDITEDQDGYYICTEPSSGAKREARLTITNSAKITVTPAQQRLRLGRTATVSCSVTGITSGAGYPQMYYANNNKLVETTNRVSVRQTGIGKIEVTIRNLKQSDDNTQLLCRYMSLTGTAQINVDRVCSQNMRSCRNGDCISSSKFCDGNMDCRDGSDEDQLYCRKCNPIQKACQYHQGKPPLEKYYQINWKCDGEDDCGNGYDESACYGDKFSCGGSKFRCRGGGKNIPRAYICDKEQDCPYGDDELNCRTPTIMRQPGQETQTIRNGDQATFICEALGYPIPRIIWRFNWGCLPNDPNRFTVTQTYSECKSVKSILTIKSFQPGDDGIYNCEALIDNTRILSNDYRALIG